jgi:hypothetical protein
MSVSVGKIVPDRRWSPLDMLEFHAAAFYKLTQLLKNFRSVVEEKKNDNPGTFKVSLYNDVLGGGSAIRSFTHGARDTRLTAYLKLMRLQSAWLWVGQPRPYSI